MVKATWFRSYVPGEQPRFDRVIQSWDTANKSTELSDYSVCTTWGQKSRKIYLLDVLRERLDYPDLKRAVRHQAERFRPANILIEDKASGTQLIQELIEEGVYGVTRYEPTMEKVMRLHSITSTIEDGFVYLPTKGDWLPGYVHELTTFPGAKYDDQADSTSQAFDWLKQGTHVYGVLDLRRQEMLAQRLRLPADYEFTKWDEGEEILTRSETTGREIRSTGQALLEVGSNTPAGQSEVCPACGAGCLRTLPWGQKRCQQCAHQWPPRPRVQQVPTRSDVLNGMDPWGGSLFRR